MRSSILHSLAATGPVAVVEVDALALENEGADAVLRGLLVLVLPRMSSDIYLWLSHCS